MIFLQENNNFNFLDFLLNELPGYFNSNLRFCFKSIKSSFIYDNNSNLNEVELNNYSLISFDSIGKGNIIENYFINNNLSNVKFNLNRNQSNDFHFNNDKNYNSYKNKENINNKNNYNGKSSINSNVNF